MHTRVDILFADPRPDACLLTVVKEVQQVIADLEAMADCHQPGTPLSLHNADVSSPLPDALQQILERCRYYREQTFGLFDPWYEGRCNLSGFLKGYALDSIRPLLEHHAIGRALVNMGNSSVMTIGHRLRDDLPEGCCLTTSGNDSPSRRHIVHPHTGQTMSGMRTVSVLTPLVSTTPDGLSLGGGALGEALSTALFLADEDQRKRLLTDVFPEARLVARRNKQCR